MPGRISSKTAATLMTMLLGLAGVAFADDASYQPSRDLNTYLVRDKDVPDHLDTPLNRLHSNWRADSPNARKSAVQSGLEIEEDLVKVTILMMDEDSAQEAISSVEFLGGRVTAHFKRSIDAWVPIASLLQINDFPNVSLVHKPLPLMLISDDAKLLSGPEKAGSYQSQGVAASNADDWQAYGFEGQGVAVALIDQFQGVSSAQAAGELPGTIYCFPDCGYVSTASPHGTACAEIVHDMAPDATITMTSVTTPTEMAQRIVDLAAAGHSVISSSYSLGILDSTPGDGSGGLASAIATARNTYGTLYVQAAGNHADYHWDGYYQDVDGDYYLEFAPGVEVNTISGVVSAGTGISAYLRWNDWSTSDQDFDLYLYYFDGYDWYLIDASENPQTGTQPPWESIQTVAPYTGLYGFAVVQYWASTTPQFDMMVWSRQELDYKVVSRSLVEPATAPSSFSVAAADVGSFLLESYSSRGPTHGGGGSISGGSAQPRISGYANVDTWAYGPGSFNGTSAAAPHVAGAAALVRGAYPTYTPAQTQSFLESRAIDRGASGYDYLYGYGRLWLGSPPCSYSISPTSASPSSSGGSGSFAVTGTASCPWTASSNAAWISVTSGSSGAGNGTVGYSVGENSSVSPRSGTITAAGKTFTVNQSGAPTCSYSISPTSVSVDAAGGTGSVTVTTTAGCQWIATSNDSWIVVTSGSSGTGSGSVGYNVLANGSPSQQSGSVTIAGHTFTVNQGGDVNVVFGDGFESNDTSAWSSTAG